MREEQARRVRMDQICLKGKEDELARRREQLSLCEAAIKHKKKSVKLVRQLSRTRRMQWNHLQGATGRGNHNATPRRKM
jgi:hypothetical protein